MANNNETKVIIGKVRFSYANVFEPKSINEGEEKYSCSILIDKDDTKTINSIKKGIENAKKSDTINLLPLLGTKAVLISSERVLGTL